MGHRHRLRQRRSPSRSVPFPPVGVRHARPHRHRPRRDAQPADDAAAADPRRREPHAEPDGIDRARQRQRRRPGARRRSARPTSCGTRARPKTAARRRSSSPPRANGTTWTRGKRRRRRFSRERRVVVRPGRRLRRRTSSTTLPTRSLRTGCGTRAAPASSARSAMRRRPTASRGSSTPDAASCRSRCSTHGPAGSADSFSAADPSVLKDGSTWKMWYTGDDSSKKRIAYATSTDGITWAKGGKVIAPEDPGRQREHRVRSVRADGLEDRRRLLDAAHRPQARRRRRLPDEDHGHDLTGRDRLGRPEPGAQPVRLDPNFDYSNLNAPTCSRTRARLRRTSSTTRATRSTRTATSTRGSGSRRRTRQLVQQGQRCADRRLDVRRRHAGHRLRRPPGFGPLGRGAGRARRRSSPASTGAREEATSSRASARRPRPTAAPGRRFRSPAPDGGALFGLGNPAAFDNGGQRDPSVLYDAGTYHLFFTGLSSGGTRSIGYASTPEDGATKQPDNSAWSTRSQVLSGDGSGFDASGVAHPSVIKDGATYVMYYAGLDSSGAAKIGRATASGTERPVHAGPARCSTSAQASEFDATSVKDPVVVKVDAGDYRMLYTGVETLDGNEDRARRLRDFERRHRVDEAWRRARPEPRRVCERRVRARADGHAGRRLDPPCLDERRRPQRPHARRPRDDGRIPTPVTPAAGHPERLGDVPARRRHDDESRLPADRAHLERQRGRRSG